MSNVLRKIREMFGFSNTHDYGYEDSKTLKKNDGDYSAGVGDSISRPGHVIGAGDSPFGGNASSEISVIEPQCFDEMPQIIQLLRDRKSVILNLNRMTGELAQRTTDFVAGGTCMIDGYQEKIADNIFLFMPNSARVETQLDLSQSVGSIYRLDQYFSSPEEESRVS